MSNAKIIVAVHGVGNQVLSETVQKVINRFCRYHGETMGVPLGKIKTLSVEKNSTKQKNPSGQVKTSNNDPITPPPPASKKPALLTSYCAPYLLLLALMFAGVFVLYKAVKASVASDELEALRYGLSDYQKEALKEFFPHLKGVYLENEVNAIGEFVNKRKDEAVADGFSRAVCNCMYGQIPAIGL